VGFVKVLEKFLWGSWKVLEKSWIFFSVKEWVPCTGLTVSHNAPRSQHPNNDVSSRCIVINVW